MKALKIISIAILGLIVFYMACIAIYILTVLNPYPPTYLIPVMVLGWVASIALAGCSILFPILISIDIYKAKTECKHGFDFGDVINTKIDPACKHCGKRISELHKQY